MKIQKVTDPAFRKYGQVLEGYDFTGLIKEMKHTPVPEDVIYVPSVEELEALDNSKPAPKKDRIVSTKMEPAVQSVSQPVKKVETPSSVKLDKKVIGRVDIAKNARFKTIVVRQDALVTGLAKDEALNRGITIVKE